MKSTAKKCFISLAAVFFATLIVCILTLSVATKSLVETVGSKVMKVPVTIGTLVVSPLGGYCYVHNLKIGNPKGYTGPYLLKIGNISAHFDLLSLLRNPIEISSIEIRKMEVIFQGGLSSNNFTAMQRNIGGSSSQSGGRSITIENLNVVGTTATLSMGVVGNKPIHIDLPPIELNHISSRNTAAVTRKVTGILVGELVREVATEIAKQELMGRPNSIHAWLDKIGNILNR